MPAYQSIPDRAEYHIQYDFMLYLPACIWLSRTPQYCDQSLAPNRGKACPHLLSKRFIGLGSCHQCCKQLCQSIGCGKGLSYKAIEIFLEVTRNVLFFQLIKPGNRPILTRHLQYTVYSICCRHSAVRSVPRTALSVPRTALKAMTYLSACLAGQSTD